MLSLGSHPAALAAPTKQSLACHGAQRTLLYQTSICSARRRADVAAEVDGPSTSYATSSVRFLHRPDSRRSSQRRVAAHALPTPEGHPLPPQASGPGKVGVVIVDHGSRKKASNDMLVEFGDLYGKVTGQEIVEIAHMEIASPSIEDAVGRCAARGARTVVIAPYFLSRGRHIQEDIPALVAEAQSRHPGLTCVIADPIGIDALMVQLISNRVAAALSTAAAAPAALEADASGAKPLAAAAAASATAATA
ncbi:hypothetical protein PLESTF_001149000 [Pleodorina starrii]|nr:hypothetical protein PLESTF_001149000 [Pleodorina starrii]